MEKEKGDSHQSRLWGMDAAHGQKSYKLISHLQLCFAAQRAFTHRTVIGPLWVGTMTNSIAQMRKLRFGRDWDLNPDFLIPPPGCLPYRQCILKIFEQSSDPMC